MLMMANYLFVCALGLGFVAGLRSMLAPAITALAAHAGWLQLDGSPLSFMGSTAAAIVLSMLALGELVADKLPGIPKRTAAAPLFARIIMGGVCGACLSSSMNHSLGSGAVLGAVGAVTGAFAGYNIRSRLVSQLHIRDFIVALSEDVVAVGLAVFCLSR
jgi:uncharacterized membrane protein